MNSLVSLLFKSSTHIQSSSRLILFLYNIQAQSQSLIFVCLYFSASNLRAFDLPDLAFPDLTLPDLPLLLLSLLPKPTNQSLKPIWLSLLTGMLGVSSTSNAEVSRLGTQLVQHCGISQSILQSTTNVWRGEGRRSHTSLGIAPTKLLPERPIKPKCLGLQREDKYEYSLFYKTDHRIDTHWSLECLPRMLELHPPSYCYQSGRSVTDLSC